MFRTKEQWTQLLSSPEVGALYVYDGVKNIEHAILNSGNHSRGFFNAKRIMQDPKLLSEACSDLAEMVHHEQSPRLCTFNRVVGPAQGAVILAHEFARVSLAYFGSSIKSAYTEKSVLNGVKVMVFNNTHILPGDHVLLIDDVVTTAESAELSAKAVEKAGGFVLPAVITILNRSGKKEINGRKIFSLIELTFETSKPDECDLCAAGISKAVRF